MEMHFSIWKSTNGQIYFELKGEEGEIVAISKLYGRKESAEETIELIKSSMRHVQVLDHSDGKAMYARELP
jgi:uncharacterized protein YegP (UPF0339 family)